jgi:chromate reductase
MTAIAVFVGSIRKQSINQRLAHAVEALAGKRFEFSYVDIGGLPHYNDDLWSDPPESVQTLKRTIEASDGVLFVTPEYNRSIPGILKNAIDWGSRPTGKSSWIGKPSAIMGASPGAVGTAVAQSHLRNTLLVLDVVLMGQPEAYLQLKPDAIADDLTIADDHLRILLERQLDAFEAWIGRVRRRHG